MDCVVIVNGWSDRVADIRVRRRDVVRARSGVHVGDFERVFERDSGGIYRVFIEEE